MIEFIFILIWGGICWGFILVFGKHKNFEYRLAALLFSIGFTPLIGISLANQLYK